MLKTNGYDFILENNFSTFLPFLIFVMNIYKYKYVFFVRQ